MGDIRDKAKDELDNIDDRAHELKGRAEQKMNDMRSAKADDQDRQEDWDTDADDDSW